MAVTIAGAASRKPRWRPMGLGVRFHMRPATSIEFRAAEAAARAKVQAAIKGLDAFAEIGLPAPTPEQLKDEYWIIGVTRWLIASDIAARVVDQWEGPIVDEQTGEPAELSRAGLADLLRYEGIERRFEAAAYAVLELVAAEGKESPPPRNGSAAEAANTARDAGTSMPLAAEGFPATADGSVPS